MIDNLEKIIIKYYLEEYFGVGIQMKVIDFEFTDAINNIFYKF